MEFFNFEISFNYIFIYEFRLVNLILITKKKLKFIYDIIDIPNSHIHLSLFVNDEKGRINFKIYDPLGKLIFNTFDKMHIFHNFYANTTENMFISLIIK